MPQRYGITATQTMNGTANDFNDGEVKRKANRDNGLTPGLSRG